MNKQQLASKIWEAANQMRSKIEANEYKDYILGFIFYKYLSENEERFLREQDFTNDDMPSLTEEDLETCQWVTSNVGYFISYQDLFSTWINKGKDLGIGDVTRALSAFKRHVDKGHKDIFDGVFTTLETGLTKLGDTDASRSKAVRDLAHLINDIPMDGREGYDALGFIYEYLISMFASNAGKKAGEFYTPHEVSVLMSQIVAYHLRGKDHIEIYDPTSGSGSLLINIGQAVARYTGDPDSIKYYAQELKANTYNLTRMNLVMRGIQPSNIKVRNGDTLEHDWPWFDESDPEATYNPLYVDAVVSNPPYSQRWDPTGKEGDPRFAKGVAPVSKADYAFLLHDLYHLKPSGVMAIVLPHGVLFRGGEEGTIRKNLVEAGNIEAIIGLPANIFFGTGIPTIVMVLRKNPEHDGILIIDASKGFVKEGKNNRLRACDIKRIVDAVEKRADIEGFCHVASIEEVRANDYNLNIPRYVDSSGKPESWDIYATMFGGLPAGEVAELDAYWQALPGLREALFVDNGTPCLRLAVDDVKAAIEGHRSVDDFKNGFVARFTGFADELRRRLVDGFADVDIPSEEPLLGEGIFARLEGVPLVDKYEAYQILDENWSVISNGLEVLQTEGFDAVRGVDPRFMLKKKGNETSEVQDGWMGHILPFEVVQRELLGDDVAQIEQAEARLASIAGEVDELAENLTDDDKSSLGDAFDEDGFVATAAVKRAKEVKKALKSGVTVDEDSPENALLKYAALYDEEKVLKKELKQRTVALQEATKRTIEGLDDDRARDMLYRVWIESLVEALGGLPDAAVANLVDRVEKLAAKYKTTYADIVQEQHAAEKSLLGMLDQLVGNEYDMRGLAEFRTLLGGE